MKHGVRLWVSCSLDFKEGTDGHVLSQAMAGAGWIYAGPLVTSLLSAKKVSSQHRLNSFRVSVCLGD